MTRFITPLLLLSATLLVFASFTTTLVLAEDASMSDAAFPSHWGQPPLRQTRDYVELPNPYGFGSGTLRKWIEDKLAEDIASSGTAAARSAADETQTNELRQWPELDLVGYTGEDAKFAILAATKDEEMNVIIIPEDSMVTMDYRTDRVRVFVNEEGKVVRQPKIG